MPFGSSNCISRFARNTFKPNSLTTSAYSSLRTMSTAKPSIKFIPRPSAERGHADHGWLKTYHTFAFASYYPEEKLHFQFGPLRVINEDWVEAGEGFPKHPHREFEIFSYILDGALAHSDSMANEEVMREGDVQMTSAGTGVAHSEYNYEKAGGKPCRFLQIWAKPNQSRLPPNYYLRHFSAASKTDKLLQILGATTDAEVQDKRIADGPTPVHANMRVWASILTPGKTLTHKLRDDTTKVYVHNTFASGYRGPKDAPALDAAHISMTGGGEQTILQEGDGLYGFSEPGAELEFSSEGGKPAHFLLFEISE